MQPLSSVSRSSDWISMLEALLLVITLDFIYILNNVLVKSVLQVIQMSASLFKRINPFLQVIQMQKSKMCMNYRVNIKITWIIKETKQFTFEWQVISLVNDQSEWHEAYYHILFHALSQLISSSRKLKEQKGLIYRYTVHCSFRANKQCNKCIITSYYLEYGGRQTVWMFIYSSVIVSIRVYYYVILYYYHKKKNSFYEMTFFLKKFYE